MENIEKKSLKYNILSPARIAGILLLSLSLSMLTSPLNAYEFLYRDHLTKEEKERKPYLRWRWFYEQRAYPLKDIPVGAYQRAREHLRKSKSIKKIQEALQFGATVQGAPQIGGNKWESIGPAPVMGEGPWSGRISTIAVHPANPNIIFIGAAEGGVWRTTNGGTSWTPLTDNQPSLAMGSIAIAPSNPDIIYAGTGDRDGGIYGAGLLRSTDGGNTWTHIPGPFDTTTTMPPTGGATITKIVVASNNPNHIVIASTIGVFYSANGGTDLTSTSTPTLTGFWHYDLAIHPTNPDIVYAGLHSGVFRSPDGGKTWAKTGVGTVSCNGFCGNLRTLLAIAPTNPNILYALIENPPDGFGMAVFRYNDQNQTWTKALESPADPVKYPNFCRNQCYYNLALAVQPIDPDGPGPLVAENIIYAGATWHLLRSTDGGNSWPVDIKENQHKGTFHDDIHSLAFDSNGALYAGNDGGIVRHTNPAAAVNDDPNWASLNGNLAITQFYPGISLHPSDPLIVMGGAQDNGVSRYSGSLQWNEVHGGDGCYTAIARSNGDTRWYSIGLGGGLYTTLNGGDSWTDVKNDLDNNGDGISDFGALIDSHSPVGVAPYVIDPNNSQTVIIAVGGQIWRTTTGALSNDPSCGKRWCKKGPLFGNITMLAIAPSDSQRYYAAEKGVIHFTATGGDIWSNFGTGFPDRFVTDLAVHPTSPYTVYATVSGFCNANPCPYGQGHVFLNITGAGAWTDISGNLPDVPVNALVLDSVNPNIIYIGTDLGIFRGIVDFPGQTPAWELFSNGLPNSPVFDLAINNDTGTLIAATYGRSMFRLGGAVYVNGSWTGNENGTVQFPYNTISEGILSVPNGGQLWIKSGIYTGPGNAPITIDKPMTLKIYEGVVTIGQ